MSKILITGACGMVGSHLLERLSADASVEVLGSYYNPTVDLAEIKLNNSQLIECDVRYSSVLNTLILDNLPQKIFHLAAQSYPVVSWARPAETMDTNSIGTINLFEAIKNAQKKNLSYDPVVVVACSSAQYGASIKETPVGEEASFLPLHPYGVSKVAQDLLAFQYFMNDNIRTIRARIFNTTGSRKKNDVISDFASRLVQATGDTKKLLVGNVNTRRAILDVSDLIDALILLSDKGVAGEAYNICSDNVYLIKDLISMMGDILNCQIEYEVDPNLLRKTDEPIILGNNSKLKNATGWQSKVSIQDTLRNVIEYYQGK